MASVGGNDNIERSDRCRTHVPLSKPIIPETEFGLGICDSAYRPKTWSGMGKLFQQETMSDVMLMAEGQSVPCHKFLLAAASEYFHNRLVGEDETGNLLEIEGVTFNALKVIVSYLYTGHLNITAENAKDVIPVCKILKLTSACDICETFALEIVSPGNCIGLYKMATAHEFNQLSAKALHVMENNFSAVVSGREFLTMSETDLTDYIQNGNLKIPNEDPVFEAVKSWVTQDQQERKHIFSQLITHVRLRYCSPRYLTQVVSKEPLMDNHECQKCLVTALVHHTAATFQDSSTQSSAGPRKGYTRTNTLIIIGGISDPGSDARTDCWCMEEAGWRVMEQCPVPVSLLCFSACVVKEGILVTGGYKGAPVDATAAATTTAAAADAAAAAVDDDDNHEPVSQCWLLSTSTYQWRPLSNLKTARARHASVCVGEQVFVIAGAEGAEKETASVECLNKSSEKWDILSDLPEALVHPMAVSHGQYIYVFGGGHIKSKLSKSMFAFGINSKSWQTLASMPQICMCGSAVVWKDRIYVVGGFQQCCLCYDPLLAQWSTLSQCRHEHADGPALVWKDRILVCGGRSNKAKREDGNAGDTSVIEEYDPETDTWTVSQIELPQKLASHFVLSTESDYFTQDYSASEGKTDTPRSGQALLIGDATIEGLHGVTTSDGKAVPVHMRPEATFNEISQDLDRGDIANCTGEIFLVCGLREATNKQHLGEIKTNLVGLVSKAQTLCDSLKVSSILPSAKPNKRINQLNDLIRDVCMQLGATFVDNNKNFIFRRNSRDWTAFRGDTNRLTAKGTLRLMGNMGLTVPRLHQAIERQKHTA